MRSTSTLLLTLLAACAAPFAARAQATYTTLATITCFYGQCTPGVPHTGLVEVQPGLFFGATDHGYLYTVNASGGLNVLTTLPGAGPFSTQTPIGASDGNLYIPDYSAFKYSLNGSLQAIPLPGSSSVVGSGSLVEDLSQTIYGSSAGSSQASTIFRLSLNGTARSYAISPASLNSVQFLIQGPDGHLYALTSNEFNNGTDSHLLRVSPGAVTDLASFPPANHFLTLAPDGYFYGCDLKSIYRLSTTGTYTTVHTFTGGSEGSDVYGCPVPASDGNFYGTTHSDGQYGFGTVYRFTLATGVVETVYSFAGTDDEQRTAEYAPNLLQGSDGKLYGITSGPFINSPGTYTGATFFSLDLGLPAPPPSVVIATPVRSDGKYALITGNYFLNATSVSFNGVSVPFTVKSARYIQAQTPAGFRAGFVTVTTPDGTARGPYRSGPN